MDTQLFFVIKISIYLLLIVVVPIWFWMQSELYNMIKEKHPEEYDKIGRPVLWSLYNPGYKAILYGKITFPNDLLLSKKIIRFRLFTIFFVVLDIAAVIAIFLT